MRVDLADIAAPERRSQAVQGHCHVRENMIANQISGARLFFATNVFRHIHKGLLGRWQRPRNHLKIYISVGMSSGKPSNNGVLLPRRLEKRQTSPVRPSLSAWTWHTTKYRASSLELSNLSAFQSHERDGAINSASPRVGYTHMCLLPL